MGNTLSESKSRYDNTVHPHTHGEHISIVVSNEYTAGSSPHAWGTPFALEIMSSKYRFIPTRMGNTITLFFLISSSSVHPHTHGEHPRKIPKKRFCAGSSPHAWGTHPALSPGPLLLRFIPTRMGNTFVLTVYAVQYPVHPHTHGEHLTPGKILHSLTGSSPHAWGTHGFDRLPNHRTRFIPTRMGNTLGQKAPRLLVPVHPHTHGEHQRPITKTHRIIGSSPHAWGTHTSQQS